ncbi:MAG: TniQ family protein [Phyllobacterium sp.]
MLSGELWPVHPKPFHDELFSSWLIRTALGNAEKVHTFCHYVWPGKQIWNRDIDVSFDEELTQILSARSGTGAEQIHQSTIRSYEGTVFEALVPGNTKWIRPAGVYHRRRRRHALQWCPQCFVEDDLVPYFRLSWRMAFAASCPRHGIILADRCPGCAEPALPHRGAMTVCHQCKTDMVHHPHITGDSIAISAEQMLAHRAVDGLTSLDGRTPLHPVAYFDIWRRLCQLVAASRRSTSLREVIAKQYGGNPAPATPENGRREFEYLSPSDRHRTIGLVARMMQEWPNRLINLCARSGNWASFILRDMNPVRYHLWEPAKRHLHGCAYLAPR